VIDLHNHILFKIDDGPDTLSGCLEMASLLSKCGYRHVVATPHTVPGTTWVPSTDSIKDHIAKINRALKAWGLDLKILPGMEISFDPQLLDLLNDKKLFTLGGKISSCLLIEAPFHRFPLGWEKLVFEIISHNYIILLAHPERCAQVAQNTQFIDHLINAGVYIQVNWGSFLGEYGQMAKRTARRLAERGQIHSLATDAHNPQDCQFALLRDAADNVQQLIGSKNLVRIARENPLRILQGKLPLPMMKSEPANEHKKSTCTKFGNDFLVPAATP
jgi:protein-tyrosine phosphatase